MISTGYEYPGDGKVLSNTEGSNGSVAASESRSGILVAEELRKTYGLRSALLGLSFSLKAGRILGFLGPNGAGKTT